MKPPLITPLGIGVGVVLVTGACWLGWIGFVSGNAETPTTPAQAVSPQETRQSAVRGGAVTLEQIQALLASLDPVLPGELENGPAIELLGWWAETDPAGAIVYAATYLHQHGRARLPAELFAAWLRRARAEATAWMLALDAGDLRSQLLAELLASSATQVPREGLLLALDLQGDARRDALTALFTQWSKVDPVAAAAAAAGLPTEEEQSSAMRDVARQWASQDLDAAVAWVTSLPPPRNPGSDDFEYGVMEAIIQTWAEQRPEDAAVHLLTIAEETRRIQMLATVAESWAGRAPGEALRWASVVAEGLDRDVLVRGVLSQVAETSSRAAAADLALTLPDAAARQQNTEFILGQWLATDPSGCAAWATAQVTRSSPETLGTLVESWARADLTSASTWLSTVPVGPARDAGSVALIRHLAPSQPELAHAWVDSISEPTLRAQERAKIDAVAGR